MYKRKCKSTTITNNNIIPTVYILKLNIYEFDKKKDIIDTFFWVSPKILVYWYYQSSEILMITLITS